MVPDTVGIDSLSALVSSPLSSLLSPPLLPMTLDIAEQHDFVISGESITRYSALVCTLDVPTNDKAPPAKEVRVS